MQRTFTSLALALAAAGALAQGAPARAPAPAGSAAAPATSPRLPPGPTLGATLEERVTMPGRAASAPAGAASGAPQAVHTFKPLPTNAFRFVDGEYQSGVSGLTMKLPQVRDEKVVSVREAVVITRPGHQIGTSHVIFVPGADGTTVERLGPVSAVVVTHLPQDRPHDRETVLKAWEPRTPEQRKQMEARGIEFHRIKTGLGEGLERVVPNRVADDNFPYRTHIEEGVRNLQSVGVTRYLVSGEQALIEFSQVFPCRELAGDACKDAALKASDRFVQGVSSFVAVRPGAGAAANPASAAKPAAAASQRK